MRRPVAYVVPALALLAAGTYVLVYLYRWEWHRALVAGVFMLAVEIGIGFALVLERLSTITKRLDDAERGAAEATRAILRDTAPTGHEPFEWLSESSQRMSVFVPILLGAGVVLSALAWLVERLAGLTSANVLERGLALRLQPLTVPAGTLSGHARGVMPPRPTVSRPRSWRWVYIVVGLALAIPMGKAFDNLEDATQNRPDTITYGSTETIVLRLHNRQAPSAAVATATSLWGACSNQIGTTYRLIGVDQAGPNQVALRVTPAVGKYAERRMRGCFGDATMEAIRAEVVSITASE